MGDSTFCQFGGVVEGLNGQIVKQGTGTLELTGQNLYTGATVINGGTLQLGDGFTSGMLGSGPITDNGSLVYDDLTNPLVPNTITGGGSVTQLGTGTLTLLGNNSYTGATIIAGGNLDAVGLSDSGVAGPLGSGNSIVFSGGMP